MSRHGARARRRRHGRAREWKNEEWLHAFATATEGIARAMLVHTATVDAILEERVAAMAVQTWRNSR